MEKSAGEITESDWTAFPIWEFDLDSEGIEGRDETWMRPVKSLPVADLANRLVSVRLRLANGSILRGILGNIHLKNPRKTRIFISLSVYTPHGDYSIRRDLEFLPVVPSEVSPETFAVILGLQMSEVFPISYDLTGLAVGPPESMRDSIPAHPAEKLTEKERMDLIFSDDS